MPAYHQFQLYLSEVDNLKEAISAYHACWQTLIGPYTQELDPFLRQIHPQEHAQAWTWTHEPYTWQGIKLSPGVQCWGADWEFSILMDTAQLVDRFGIILPRSVGPLTSIAATLSAHFPDAPLFLTDELSDGRPWEALREGDPDGIWQFDLAVIPREWQIPFSNPPGDYARGVSGTDTWYFREACWPEGPL